MEVNQKPVLDIIQYSMQIGRLDFVSALLACIGVLMVFGGIFAFLNIRGISQSVAREVATETAEKVTNKYLQDNLPIIIEAYDEFIEHQVNASVANQIAMAQEDGQNGNS
jgi:hypothetical protein